MNNAKKVAEYAGRIDTRTLHGEKHVKCFIGVNRGIMYYETIVIILHDNGKVKTTSKIMYDKEAANKYTAQIIKKDNLRKIV